MEKLNRNFLNELFHGCIRNDEIMAICHQYLEYQFLPNEEYKEIFKNINTIYKTLNVRTTFGSLSQEFKSKIEILKIIGEIKDTKFESTEVLIYELEDFLKDCISVQFYDDFYEIYNKKGNKDEARKLLDKTAKKLNDFTLRKNNYSFERVFADFEVRQSFRENAENDVLFKKIASGIDEVDEKTDGFIELTDTALFLAQSGVGKTKLLRWLGVEAARRGFKVLHIQGEGSKRECILGYDATWTALAKGVLEYRGIKDEQLKAHLRNILQSINHYGGEICVEAFEQFGSFTTRDIKNKIDDFVKIYGAPPDLVLVDYFELAGTDPLSEKTYRQGDEVGRLKQLGKEFKNLAVSAPTRLITCTQGSTVRPEDLNNPDFVMTRYDISGHKAVLNSFSYFFTLNQTKDEYLSDEMRIYADKLRHQKGKWTIKIKQAYDFEKFYDRFKTQVEILGNQDFIKLNAK